MMRPIIELLRYENSVFRNYAFWSAFLVVKTAVMALLPLLQPKITKLFFQPKPEELEDRIKFDLNRVRGAHRNDLENIVLIIIVWFLYVITDPAPDVAINLFRVTVAFRLWHTLVYAIYPIRQPARVIGFAVPYFIMLYMAVVVMVVFFG